MEYQSGHVYDLMDAGGPTDVPDYAVAGGVPAKVIRMLDPKEPRE